MPTIADLGTAALNYARETSRLSNIEQVAEAFRQAIAPLGLTGTACGVVSGPRLASGARFFFLDWPPDWMDEYSRENFLRVDPIPRWAAAGRRAASFQQILAALPDRDPARRVAEAGYQYGIVDGMLVPLRLGDGSLGVVSAFGERTRFSASERAFLEVIAATTLLRADALGGQTPASSVALTPRELDCLALLVRGLTDRDIAAKLKVTEPTIRFHLGRAREKLGARSRTHLAALAVWLGFAKL
jgi:DNA-binding CsgD family transcriptional regulator